MFSDDATPCIHSAYCISMPNTHFVMIHSISSTTSCQAIDYTQSAHSYLDELKIDAPCCQILGSDVLLCIWQNSKLNETILHELLILHPHHPSRSRSLKNHMVGLTSSSALKQHALLHIIGSLQQLTVDLE